MWLVSFGLLSLLPPHTCLYCMDRSGWLKSHNVLEKLYWKFYQIMLFPEMYVPSLLLVREEICWDFWMPQRVLVWVQAEFQLKVSVIYLSWENQSQVILFNNWHHPINQVSYHLCCVSCGAPLTQKSPKSQNAGSLISLKCLCLQIWHVFDLLSAPRLQTP